MRAEQASVVVVTSMNEEMGKGCARSSFTRKTFCVEVQPGKLRIYFVPSVDCTAGCVFNSHCRCDRSIKSSGSWLLRATLCQIKVSSKIRNARAELIVEFDGLLLSSSRPSGSPMQHHGNNANDWRLVQVEDCACAFSHTISAYMLIPGHVFHGLLFSSARPIHLAFIILREDSRGNKRTRA